MCQDQGILLQAYSSLGGSSERRLLEDATVGSVAKKLDRSPAQVLLCWALQQGIGELIYCMFDDLHADLSLFNPMNVSHFKPHLCLHQSGCS